MKTLFLRWCVSLSLLTIIIKPFLINGEWYQGYVENLIFIFEAVTWCIIISAVFFALMLTIIKNRLPNDNAMIISRITQAKYLNRILFFSAGVISGVVDGDVSCFIVLCAAGVMGVVFDKIIDNYIKRFNIKIV